MRLLSPGLKSILLLVIVIAVSVLVLARRRGIQSPGPRVVDQWGRSLDSLFGDKSPTATQRRYFARFSASWNHLPNGARGCSEPGRRYPTRNKPMWAIGLTAWLKPIPVQASGWCGVPTPAPCPNPSCSSEYCWAGADNCREGASSCLCMETKPGTCC